MGAALDDPRRPGGEHHEHSGHPQPALQREGDTLLEKPGESAHHQHQRGSAEGGCVAALLQASTCASCAAWAQPLWSIK